MSVFGQRRRVLEQFADDRCGGKIPCDSEYLARLLAQGAINRRSDRLRPRVAKLYVYHCPDCDRWHMTSSPPRPGHPHLTRHGKASLMTDQEFDAITYRTVDPDHVLHGKPLPAMTTLLYSVCNNDEMRFQEALRLVRLFCEAAVAGK